MPQIPLSRISGMMCAWRGCAATFDGETPPGWMNLLTRDIEERTEPCRPEMDVDVISTDIDAVDQGGKEGTLACSGQLGPALADFHGARDQPALR